VVKRTFGWLTRYRRLVRGYEARLDVFEEMIYAALCKGRRDGTPPGRA
jgi:hypothetical protein